MHRRRGARFWHCCPIVVPTILGANMFLGDFVSTMWFSTCGVHPARIGGHGRTRRQNEWDPCGRVAILVSREASAYRKPQFHPHKQLIALATFGTKNCGCKKWLGVTMQRLGLLMGVLFFSRIDAPKRSGGKKYPSLVGISTIYEIAKELAWLRVVKLLHRFDS